MSPIVIAHHLIFTAYGWWLPNDPRGSSSHTIRVPILDDLGEIHEGRKRIQPAGWEIREFYENAGPVLRQELLLFDARDQALIAESFAEVVRRDKYTCWSCAIMPDQVHLVIRKHKHLAEEMIENFQNESRLRLRVTFRRSQIHPVWGGPGWAVFLDHPTEVRRTNRYVEENPSKQRLPAQHWDFVTPYDDWPLHEGHSTNSPYARRLKAAGRYP